MWTKHGLRSTSHSPQKSFQSQVMLGTTVLAAAVVVGLLQTTGGVALAKGANVTLPKQAVVRPLVSLSPGVGSLKAASFSTLTREFRTYWATMVSSGRTPSRSTILQTPVLHSSRSSTRTSSLKFLAQRLVLFKLPTIRPSPLLTKLQSTSLLRTRYSWQAATADLSPPPTGIPTTRSRSSASKRLRAQSVLREQEWR